MRKGIYCEKKENGECGHSESCNGIIRYDFLEKSYYANIDLSETRDPSQEFYCTFTVDLTLQERVLDIRKRQTESLEKIANKMEIKE